MENTSYHFKRFIFSGVFGAGISTRHFSKYEEYVALQLRKTSDPERRSRWLTEEWDEKLQAFETLFADVFHEYSLTPKRALCVGARTGQEVQALQNMGIESIGVDLVPNEPLVIFGDMHSLPFKDKEFDFVFSNCFDHSLYPDQFVKETERVVASKGMVCLHVQLNRADDEFGVTDLYSAASLQRLFSSKARVAVRPLTNALGMNLELVAIMD